VRTRIFQLSAAWRSRISKGWFEWCWRRKIGWQFIGMIEDEAGWTFKYAHRRTDQIRYARGNE